MKNILKKGIDVSSHQGKIDWDKVKAGGVEFAIIRCGYGSDIKEQDDVEFERNISECARVGIPYGVYLYSYADSVEKARSEAHHTLRMLNGRKPDYPIFYDIEDAATTGKCTKEQILEFAKTYTGIIEAAGRWVGIYANLNWNKNYLTDPWYNTKARWIAQWADACTYEGEYGIWQYTSKGSVDGIQGNVDMNYAYIDYPTLIKGEAEPVTARKSNEETAREVIAGLWGNGEERKQRLTAAGYNYGEIQQIVNAAFKTPQKKSNAEIAKEVIRGLWGNGAQRKESLTKAGYNYSEVQATVNKMLK